MHPDWLCHQPQPGYARISPELLPTNTEVSPGAHLESCLSAPLFTYQLRRGGLPLRKSGRRVTALQKRASDWLPFTVRFGADPERCESPGARSCSPKIENTRNARPPLTADT